MLIQKAFNLFGETYKVKRIVKIDRDDSWGEFSPEKNVIKIKKGINEEQADQAYCHELVHCILTNLGYSELNEDEKFVDRIGKALHQILTSGRE